MGLRSGCFSVKYIYKPKLIIYEAGYNIEHFTKVDFPKLLAIKVLKLFNEST